jgi:hypothetical protein
MQLTTKGKIDIFISRHYAMLHQHRDVFNQKARVEGLG